MSSRLIKDMTQDLQAFFMVFSAKMAEAQIPFVLTCTYRSQAEQDALYAQGRTAPGKVVTWTKNSMHTAGKAFDIAIVRNDKVSWDIKVDVNDNLIPDYKEAGLIGEKCGLEWGGRFGSPDMPHFQLKAAV